MAAELEQPDLIREAFGMFSDGRKVFDEDPKLSRRIIGAFFDRDGSRPGNTGLTVTRGDFLYVVSYTGRKTREELDLERFNTIPGGIEKWRRARIELGYSDSGSLQWANFQHYFKRFVEGRGQVVSIFTNDQPAIDGNQLVIRDFRSAQGLGD